MKLRGSTPKTPRHSIYLITSDEQDDPATHSELIKLQQQVDELQHKPRSDILELKRLIQDLQAQTLTASVHQYTTPPAGTQTQRIGKMDEPIQYIYPGTPEESQASRDLEGHRMFDPTVPGNITRKLNASKSRSARNRESSVKQPSTPSHHSMLPYNMQSGKMHLQAPRFSGPLFQNTGRHGTHFTKLSLIHI